MKFYPRLIALLGMLVAVPALAGIPDSPQQVQPLSVGASADFRGPYDGGGVADL